MTGRALPARRLRFPEPAGPDLPAPDRIDAMDEPFDRWMRVAFLIYAATFVFEAPLRYALSAASLDAAIYGRDLLPLFVVGATLANWARRDGRLEPGLVAIACGTVTAAMVALLTLHSASQMLFGAKVLLPMAAGLALGPSIARRPGALLPVCTAFFLSTAIGVLVDSLVRFPWAGQAVFVGQTSVIISKDWDTGEWRRIGGFARASYDAAIIAVTCAIVMMVGLRSIAARLAVWAVTIAVVAITTTKGVLLAFGLVSLVLLAHGYATQAGRAAARLLLPVLFVAGCVLPLWSMVSRPPASGLDTGDMAPLLSSFVDRMVQMWPDAGSLLVGPMQVLHGRGLGGIGVAQVYFEPALGNAADNLFVYLLVSAGAAGMAFYALLLVRCMQSTRAGPVERLLTALAVLVAAYGITTNLIESPFMGFLIGVLAATPHRIALSVTPDVAGRVAAPRVPLGRKGPLHTGGAA